MKYPLLAARRLRAAAVLSTAAMLAACGSSQDPTASTSAVQETTNASASVLKPVPVGEQVSVKIDPRLHNKTGPLEVWVTLDQPAAAVLYAKRAAELGLAEGQAHRQMKANAQVAKSAGNQKGGTPEESAVLKTMRGELATHREKLNTQQTSFAAAVQGLGGRELGRVNTAHNAVALRIDATQLNALAGLSGVARVRPVVHYKLHLAETVPAVGGAALQQSGFDGTGVTVAVVDSGIDYTHRNLGGPGTTAAYAQAAGAGPDDAKAVQPNALFPSAKVVGGFDFVGDKWSGQANSPERTEDPNPIDYWFHGTNVADIVAGASLDGKHKGMAPGAKLLAVKACASVSGSCNGIALLKAMDFSIDPNGDGDFSDAADVINLSLGSDFGQPEDDLSFAAANAVDLGVVVVASAGNGGNVAAVVGSPSTAAGVISVAQTEVPSAKAAFIDVTAPAAIAGRITQVGEAAFAPVTAALSGQVVYLGRGCVADSALGIAADDPYQGSPAGKIALIDRGGCGFSVKTQRAAQAGAKGVIIGMVAPGAPLFMAITPGTSVFVPTLMITQAASDALKAQLSANQAVSVTFDRVAVANGVRPTSARGPSNGTNRIKPEIGAPGASVSADVGTGTGEQPFGGTSGAAPMVSGAAAQLLQAFPQRTPLQIKAMLMNTAFTDILSSPVAEPGVLAPIARIGAGELRVDRAAATQLIAYNPGQQSAALSYGYRAISQVGTYSENLRIQNFGDAPKTVSLSGDFRYDDDRTSGAVRVIVPTSVTVPARGAVTVPVTLTVDARKLPNWVQEGSDLATAGTTFARNEFDGFITLKDGDKKVTVPWHIMPRKASNLLVNGTNSTRSPLTLVNAGVQPAVTEVFALTGISKKIPNEQLPQPGSNASVTDLRAVGVRLPEAGVVQFGISTFGSRSTPLSPAGFVVDIDANSDGTPEFAVFNRELAADTGVVVSAVFDYATGTSRAFFFVDADFYSGNMILTAPLQALGLTEDSTFSYTVTSFDNYFTGNNGDTIGPMTFTLSKPKFRVDGAITQTVNAGRPVLLRTQAVQGGDVASPSQTGLLLLHRGNEGQESAQVTLRR
jgi:minor extracellular serine protease Vpr